MCASIFTNVWICICDVVNLVFSTMMNIGVIFFGGKMNKIEYAINLAIMIRIPTNLNVSYLFQFLQFTKFQTTIFQLQDHFFAFLSLKIIEIQIIQSDWIGHNHTVGIFTLWWFNALWWHIWRLSFRISSFQFEIGLL